MDLTDTIKVSRIGLGEGRGRKFLGLFWFAPNKGLTGHKSLRCSSGNFDPTTADRLPVFEEEGVIRLGGHSETIIKMCTLCPEPTKEDWKDWAACKGTAGAAAETRKERGKFIKKFCDNCAVQSECLDYGEANANDNAGMVWGGIYFSHSTTERNKHIANQRRRIESGELG